MSLCGYRKAAPQSGAHPPVHLGWHWAGKNRTGDGRKDGGVRLLRCPDMQWQGVDDSVDHFWALGDVLGMPTVVCVVYVSVGSKQHTVNTQRVVEQ